MKLKWYDEIACAWFAIILTSNLLTLNILGIILNYMAWIIYREWRKNEST